MFKDRISQIALLLKRKKEKFHLKEDIVEIANTGIHLKVILIFEN